MDKRDFFLAAFRVDFDETGNAAAVSERSWPRVRTSVSALLETAPARVMPPGLHNVRRGPNRVEHRPAKK